jgi:FkbM family methyltransferase
LNWIDILKRLNLVLGHIDKHPLSKRHRLVAYKKLISWQIGQLIRPGEKVIPFVGNTCLAVNKGMNGATGNIYVGLHDFSEMGFLLHFLTTDDLFADIGANIGSYSVLASGVSKAKTIAFEPSEKTFKQLQKNIALNHIEDKVKAYNLALGSKKDTLLFTIAFDTVNHVIPHNSVASDIERVEIYVDTLDNLVEENVVPALIKIDVEGFETEVVNGMNRTLANERLKAIIVELNGSGQRYGYDENVIHKKLVLSGFDPYLYDPFQRNFSILKSYGDINTLYIRDIEFVKQRVLKAPKVTIFNEHF